MLKKQKHFCKKNTISVWHTSYGEKNVFRWFQIVIWREIFFNSINCFRGITFSDFYFVLKYKKMMAIPLLLMRKWLIDFITCLQYIQQCQHQKRWNETDTQEDIIEQDQKMVCLKAQLLSINTLANDNLLYISSYFP